MLYAEETWVNRTRGYRGGSSGVYETSFDTVGEAFKGFRREYGRCDGKVYVDTPDGSKQIGWVFVKRQKYDDANETYLRETWVTLHADKPSRTIEYSYADFGDKA